MNRRRQFTNDLPSSYRANRQKNIKICPKLLIGMGAFSSQPFSEQSLKISRYLPLLQPQQSTLHHPTIIVQMKHIMKLLITQAAPQATLTVAE